MLSFLTSTLLFFLCFVRVSAIPAIVRRRAFRVATQRVAPNATVAAAVICNAQAALPKLDDQHGASAGADARDAVRLMREEDEAVALLKHVAGHSLGAVLVCRRGQHLAALKVGCVAQHDIRGEERSGVIVRLALIPAARPVFMEFYTARRHATVGSNLVAREDAPMLCIQLSNQCLKALNDGFHVAWHSIVLQVQFTRHIRAAAAGFAISVVLRLMSACCGHDNINFTTAEKSCSPHRVRVLSNGRVEQ